MSPGLLLERNLFLESPKDCALKYPEECSSAYLVPSDGNPATDANGASCPSTTNFAPLTPTSLNITDGDPYWENRSYIYAHLSTTDIDCTDALWSEACTWNYCDQQETIPQQAGILMAIPYIVIVAATFVFIWSLWRGARWIEGRNGGSWPCTFSDGPCPGSNSAVSVSALWPSVPFYSQRQCRGSSAWSHDVHSERCLHY